MVLSNEPGYYRADAFGIRIENLELVVETPTTKQNRIVSVGFNGYPHGVSDSVDTDERELKYLKTLHAEAEPLCAIPLRKLFGFNAA